MPEKKLTVSASPHVRSAQTVSGIMLNVIIALIPALAASVWLFGPRVLLICLVTIGTCMLSEYLSRKIMKRSNIYLLIGFCINLNPSGISRAHTV